MKSLFFNLIFGSACFMFCQPATSFGQDDKTSAKTKPPVLVRYFKPTRAKTKINRRNSAAADAKNKRKKTVLRRKVDMSKVPQFIKPAN